MSSVMLSDMGRGQGTISAATTASTAASQILSKRTLQDALPDHLHVTDIEEGTISSFLAEAEAARPGDYLPVTPERDQPALKLSFHTHGRHYPQGLLHPGWVTQGIYLELHEGLPAPWRVYEDQHQDDTYGDDPMIAIETIKMGSRGAVDYSVVIYPWTPDATL